MHVLDIFFEAPFQQNLQGKGPPPLAVHRGFASALTLMYSLKSLGLEDDEEEAEGKSDGVGNFPKEAWRIFWDFVGEKNPRRVN